MITACYTSVRPVVEFPPDADWRFEYYDCFGIKLQEGKFSGKFNEKENTFSLSLMDSVWGDNVMIEGTLEKQDTQTNTYHFTAKGNWFKMEGEYKFEGDFSPDLKAIYDGAVAYPIEKEEDLKDILLKMETYRSARIEYERLSKEKGMNGEKPEKPLTEDYTPEFFTWKARFMSNDDDEPDE